MLKAELEALVAELEAEKEENIKLAKQAIDQLYPKSFGDVRVEHYCKVINLCRMIAGIPEPKENE